MKTDDLVAALASDAAPVAAGAAEARFHAKLSLAVFAALLAMLAFQGLRPDLALAAGLAMFWLKLAFPACLALTAWLAVRRLSYPGMRLGRLPLGAMALVGLMWAMAAAVLLNAAPGERLALVLGTTWRQCSTSIALLSAPALWLTLWSVRGLAPTRLALTGAAAGLFAGAAAAAAYSLHCPEMEAPFLAVWYVLGMLAPTLAGALIGPRVLRWK